MSKEKDAEVWDYNRKHGITEDFVYPRDAVIIAHANGYQQATTEILIYLQSRVDDLTYSAETVFILRRIAKCIENKEHLK